MERRELLKYGLAAPLVFNSSIAQASGDGFDASRLLKHAFITISPSIRPSRFVVTNASSDKSYALSIVKLDPIDDSNPNGQVSSTAALKGAQNVGNVYVYNNNLHAVANQTPQVRRAPFLIQARYNNDPFSLRGSIRMRPLNKRQSNGLPDPSMLRSQLEVADLFLNGSTFIVKPNNRRHPFHINF